METNKQTQPEKVALNADGGCPKGYTLINGECVYDITPPPPIKSEKDVED